MKRVLRVIVLWAACCSLTSCDILLYALAGAMMGSTTPYPGYTSPPNPANYMNQSYWNYTAPPVSGSTSAPTWGGSSSYGSGSYDSGTSSSGSYGSGNSFDETHGMKPCHLCHGTGTCQSCLGTGLINYEFGAGKLPCPNCDSNHNGKCGVCHGTGQVYGRTDIP